MGKKKKGKKQSSQEATAPAKKVGRRKKNKQAAQQMIEGPNWIMTGLAVAGMLLTGYLSITKWFGNPPLFCDEGSSCDIVQQSRWGTFLGMPVAFWGFITYAILGHIGYRVRKEELHRKSAWTLSLIGLGYSTYLTAISIFSIEAACTYCIASFLIMAAIFGVATYQLLKELPEFKFKSWAIESAVIVVLIVGGMHLHYSGVFSKAAGPEDTYLKGLAEHLTTEKAIMYGAFW